ncbi:MAG: sterol desaturase [Thiothrix nivea]|nr:MAG: sterol desaturase [Thiothrix nivea]
MIEDFLSTTFFDPTKRVFIGYLLSAWVLALVWLWLVRRQTLAQAWGSLFNRKVWLSASAFTDYALLIGNRLIMALVSPQLLGQLAVAAFIFEGLHRWLRPEAFADWPSWLVISLFTLALFLLDDASRYWVHRWLHRSAILWQFHRVHHSATTLNPLTIFRTHPLEGLLFSLRSALVQGFCIGLFVFLFGAGVDLATVFGVNVLLFLFNVLGANLRHSPVPLSYPHWLERWLISPVQHQIHHSTDPRHYDRNFGVVLAIWDRLGGSLHLSEPDKTLDFGIIEQGSKVQQNLWQAYVAPFTGAGRIIRCRLFRVTHRVIS